MSIENEDNNTNECRESVWESIKRRKDRHGRVFRTREPTRTNVADQHRRVLKEGNNIDKCWKSIQPSIIRNDQHRRVLKIDTDEYRNRVSTLTSVKKRVNTNECWIKIAEKGSTRTSVAIQYRRVLEINTDTY